MISGHILPPSCRFQSSWIWRLLMLTPTYFIPIHQKNVHKLIMPSLNNYYKTSHYFLRVGTHGFEDISLLWPPFSGKVIKLFFCYFTQSCVAQIRFGAGVQRSWAFRIKDSNSNFTWISCVRSCLFDFNHLSTSKQGGVSKF